MSENQDWLARESPEHSGSAPVRKTNCRIAEQVFRHMRIERFTAALPDAQQLVQHPLQAVLVEVELGYLLSRTEVRQ